MNQEMAFSELQIEMVRKQAEEKRRALGFVGETPIAGELFTILENMNIVLLGFPIKSDTEKPAFSAAMMYSKEGGEVLVFIGLNTADYFDKQLFAIAHELYHFFTKTGSHLSRVDEEGTQAEALANRFAAEFLLPKSVLERTVIDEFKTSSLHAIPMKKLLRFIARLQCTWWLPYRSLVKRLKEIDAINDEQYEGLYAVDERDLGGEYGRMGLAINDEVFRKLNTATHTTHTSPKSIELIIRNFEDNLIDEDKFADALALFGKTPDNFGYDYEVSEEDLDELRELFDGEVDHGS